MKFVWVLRFLSSLGQHMNGEIGLFKQGRNKSCVKCFLRNNALMLPRLPRANPLETQKVQHI